ncbi:hypothetical protein P5V15_014532 [Pogonomyrmex californicus]
MGKGNLMKVTFVTDKGRARRRTPLPSSDRGGSGRIGTPGFQGTRKDSLAGISRVDQEQDAGTALFPGYEEVSAGARTGVRLIENDHGPCPCHRCTI